MVQDPMPPLSILNGKPSLLPGPELLHDLVRLSSASSNVAIDFLEHGSRRQLTYKELHAQTDGLARRIQCTLSKLRHASPVVPIFLPQCPELYIAMIGILKAGKAFCPLNLDTPAERLDFILGDLASQLVITSTACRLDIFDTTDVELLFIDQEPPAQKPELFPEVPHIETTDWAYVLYTSGSTGLPKAVPLSHRAVTQSLLAHERHIPSFSRFLQFAAPTFDVSIFEVFFPLLRGKTLVGCSRSEMLNDLPSVIRLLEVDAVELTPTVVSNMLQGRERLPGLNLLLTIGEMLTKHVVDEFGGTSSRPSILYGMYGPTEAAIHCTLQANFQSTSPVGSIGYPLDTVSAFIMHPASESKPSPDLTILPLGEIGELVVGGYQLADGYLNRPELTASAFIQHSEFGLLYRTGDKARILSNGTLECLGRMVSGQIKLKGQRVELGEIEQAILRTPGCRSTSVLVVDDRLLAFCVVAATEVTSHTIIESCGRWLPPHMVPADITILSAMPQLPSGKVDKEALRIQYLEKRRQIKAAPISDNRSPIEVAIRDVLDRDVSLQTPLANFGLDSLRSIRIASILRKRGYDVAAFDVLSARNLQDLLSICNQKPLLNGFTASGKRNGFKRPSLLVPDFVRTHGEVVDIIPCTPLQLAMLAETISRPRAYCNWIEVEFQGHYSYGYIRDLIERLVQENEILRSGFFANSEAAGTFVQVIWKQLNEGQISNVTSFSKDYTLSSIESMLRPFAVQVNAALQRPRILLQIHHALYDGWSVDLLLRDMDRLFEGKTLDQRSQYREVVNFYTKAPHQPSYQEHASFWADLLEGYHPVRLPNFNGKVVNDSAHRSLCRRSTVNPHVLMSQAQRYMVNPQVFFQGALSRMISYYLGSLDVVIGTVTSGRTIPIAGIEEIYGPCIASLPFRFDFTKCSTIEDMLSRIQKANRDIVQHCILPLRDIGNLCGVRPGTPLFDVLFVWQQSLYSGHTDSNATVVDQVDNLEYKLTVEFQPQDSCIQSKVTYNPGFIPEAQVKNLLHQIDDIVNYLLRDVSAEFTGLSQCFSLPYLSIANPSPEIKHFEHGPAHSVERWASETPDKKALLFGTMTNGSISPFQRLTYRTLNAQANKLAHALAERGAANGELVCVLMEKSPSLYIAILAILKLGCGYLPIVPDSPPERTRRILQDAEVDMCLVDASSSEESRSRLPCAIFDIDSSDISAYPESNIRTVYDGSRLAYAVFTSGSTGSPKGVLVTQDNLMSNLDYLNGLYPTSKSSRLLQACSQAFDVSVFEIFFAWYAGICLCSASKDDLFHNLEGAINVLEVTHLSLTPTVASLINPDNVPNVQFLVTAGEAITEHVRRQWAGRGLYQGYGPSETTNICTVRGPFTTEDLINNIGAPFDTTSAFVMEPDSERILPRGAVGELCFGGAQVFRGYLKMPDLNKQKILNHPEYGRIYRSGDMGMLLPDGSILFTGRLDDQVKVRGQRVELGEITSTILNNDGVEDCATLLLQQADQKQRLVAFWVPVRGSTDTFEVLTGEEFISCTAEMFEALVLSLPSYMMPTQLVPISRIPSTAQSKINKRKLYSAFESLSSDYLESVSYNRSQGEKPGIFLDDERDLAEALSKTTGVPLTEISRSASFFNLGLDSISAIKFSRLLKDANVTDVPISVILKNASVARLSHAYKKISERNAASQDNSVNLADIFAREFCNKVRSDYEVRKLRVEKILPCTPLQEAMLAKTSSSANGSYCNTAIFNVNGDIYRLQKIWAEMFERHEILRTAFVPTDNARHAFAQVVLGFGEMKFEELGSDQNVHDVMAESISALLSSSRPPVRLAIKHTGESKQLIFSCHHALYDGAAISILLQEIEQRYLGHDLPPSVSYEVYLQHMMQQQNSPAADHFWSARLADVEPTLFPCLSGMLPKPHASPTYESTTKALSSSLSDATNFCQQESVSLLPLVQLIWAKLLHFYTGEEDICLGNVMSGRMLSGQQLDRLVAPCFNTLPVRVKFSRNQNNRDMLRVLHAFNIDSMPYQLTPLRRIMSLVNKGTSPLFDTLVILQQPDVPLNDSIWRLEADYGTMDLPVVCEMFQDRLQNTLRLTLHYDTSLLAASDADIVVETFNEVMKSVLQLPELSAQDPIGIPASILAVSNPDAVTMEPKCGPLLHSAFEEQVTLHPEHPALEFQRQKGANTVWTYADLNSKANQIASGLLNKGVVPGDFVPIYISKSPEFYASLLGVLKAGAAFTPIQPDLPLARKQFMMCELEPKVLLCVDNSCSDWGGEVPCLDVGTTTENSKETPLLPEGLGPSSLAYCLYTSGSTGAPKAVTMEHRAPIQTIESSRMRIPWERSSRLLQYAATTFDMCYYDCFVAWSFGITLCAAEQGAMLNDLTGIIRSLQVDLLDLTPSVAASLRRVEVPCVNWLYCIGEAMTPNIIQEWEGACGNSYGPTEAAFCTTIFPVERQRSSNIIGKPFPTVSFSVYPRSGERVLPVFGLGELYIGGAQLARGYYNRSKLTEETFVTHDNKRLYKSGDLVRMLGDGNFEFVGRVDDQVKIRGLRVELGEINHIVSMSDTRIRTVNTQILKRDSDKKHQLVAFVATATETSKEDQLELRKSANAAAVKHLPTYMVPQFYVFVDHIPKSPAGKIDKKALGRIFSSTTEEHSGTAADESHEWTPTEIQVREVFAKFSATPIEKIRHRTSIYELGLDSISAVQIAAALRREGRSASVTDVLKYTNCTDLAAHLDQNHEQATSEAPGFDFGSFDRNIRDDVLKTLSIKNDDALAIRPCTPVQCGMLSQFLASNGKAYFNYIKLRLHYGIDLSRLKAAWRAVMVRHEMLRTGFLHTKDRDHVFAMIHYSQGVCELPWDGTTMDNSKPESEWLAEMASVTLQNFQRPPWRIRSVTKDGEQYLDLAILHAIFDAQSLGAIFNEVSRAYSQSLDSPAISIEPVIGSILNLSQDGDATSVKFWEQLGNGISLNRFPNLAPLRYDPAPPVVTSKTCATSSEDLEAGCRKSNVTIQAAGIASWTTILSAYTGASTATCGVVLSGRNFDAAESAVFPCITTVPFMCTVGDDKVKLLADVMMWNAEVQQHQFVPLNRIQRLAGHANEPLFDTIFTYQKTANNESRNDLWTVVDEKASIEYPISIELEPKGGHLELRLTYLPHMIPEAQAGIILDQLDHLITRFIFHTASVAEQSFDSSLYSITPPKQPTIPSEARLLHEFVENSALQYPERVAMEFAIEIDADGRPVSKTWTYAELDAQGNRVANLLILNGTEAGSLVGICYNKCPEAYFAILGILKAGCAFVALDPAAPIARRAFIVEDSAAQIVLSAGADAADLRGASKAKVLSLDASTLLSMSPENPKLPRPIDPQDRSYCLYTSGTTGTPKGCEITHENAVQALASFKRIFTGHWNDDSRWLQFASFHFDVSVLEQFWSWKVGIRLISAPRDLIFEDLARTINALSITHIDLTPSLARLLHPDDVPSLCKGVFITGGESLRQDILDAWGPVGVIYNGYGPTEATIGVTMYPRVPENGKPSNIGPQFDNVGSFVLRPGTDIPVLRGGVGELCVSGKLVGKGYLNRPDLTTERFPYLARFEERVYRTGDLVRILHDGTFDFLGRADDQVKLRGQRLEIGEINAVIKQSCASISDVATLVLKHPKQQKEQLVSFLVTSHRPNVDSKILLEGSGDTEAAREACRAKLPGYMVPTHFVNLTTMPLSVNNKADHKRLKEMYSELSVGELQLLSGQTSVEDEKWSPDEEKIRHVLQDMLQISPEVIKKSTSLFELGLDSVSVISFSRSLNQVGFANAAASVVMKNSTIQRLCKALTLKSPNHDDGGSVLAAQQTIMAMQHRHRRTVMDALSVSSADIETLAPCTPLQEGIIARSLESEHGLYFNAFYFNISKDTNLKKVISAWEEVFAKTQILRSVFVNTEDGYMQAVLRNKGLPWNACSDNDDESLMDWLRHRKTEWYQANRSVIGRPFELYVGASPGRRVLAVHIFHALYDGTSIDMIFKSAWETFNQRAVEVGPDFHSVLAHGPLRQVAGAKEFWTSHLSGYAPCLVSTAPKEKTGDAVIVYRELRNLSGYESVRRRLNVTPQAVAQACWATVLSNHFKSCMTLGLVVSGRSIDFDDAENVIGPMFNTLPYRHHVSTGASWASVIKQSHDFNVAALPYQHTPLRDIIKWTKRNTGQPLFDNLFVYQIAEEELPWAKNDKWELDSGGADADYPLALEAEQHANDVLKLTLVAQKDVIDEMGASQLLDEFEKALKVVSADPDAIVPVTFVDNETLTGESPSHGQKEESSANEGSLSFEWTPTANTIREEMASLAGVSVTDIDATTSILELGLDSIDAIKLSSKLKKRGIDLRVSAIMRGLTIANIVKECSESGNEQPTRPVNTTYQSHKKALESIVQQNGTGIRFPDVEKILPLTPLQEAMVAEMLASRYERYYNHAVLKVEPGVDLERLKKAWVRVVEGSPILRTGFLEVEDVGVGDSFAMVVWREGREFLGEMKVEGEPDFPGMISTIRERSSKEIHHGPLFHLNVVEASHQTYLVLSIAHALYDGWSLGLLHSDVQRAYQGEFEPRPDIEVALEQILTSSGSEAAAYWQDYLSGAKPSFFRVAENPSEQSKHTVHRMERTSKVHLDNLVSFAKSNNITLQALAQTVYALALASHVKSLDVTFGSVLSGRDDEQLSEILFPTMNTVACRVILHGTRRRLVRYVQENLLNVKQWQHFPLRKAQALAGAHGALFNSLFIYQKGARESKNGQEKLYTMIDGESDVEYPVCVEVEVVDGCFLWRCAIKEEVFGQEATNEFLRSLDTLLEEVVERPEVPTTHFTASGISICGLPPLRNERTLEKRPVVIQQDTLQAIDAESPTLKAIREVLATVSGTAEEDIGNEKSIFHIGLDSISAIKVSSLLRKRSIKLSVGEMLKAGTIGDMARVVDERQARQHESTAPEDAQAVIAQALEHIDLDHVLHKAGLGEASIETIMPTTAGQNYMLAMWHNSDGALFYPEFKYRLDGTISHRNIQMAWQFLVSANPILRTAILPTEDARYPWGQFVLGQPWCKPTVESLTGYDEETALNVIKNRSLKHPHVHVFVSESATGWDLRLKIHHALYDGVSLPLLMQQFQDLCNGHELPPASHDSSFRQLIAASETPSAYEERRTFWTSYLSGIKQRLLPQSSSISHPRRTSKTEVFIPGLLKDTSRLEDLGKQHGISIQSLFLAAYAKLYAALVSTPKNDIVIGIYLANRSHPDLDDIAPVPIPTVNLVPLRVVDPLGKSKSILDVASQIQKDLRHISTTVNAAVSLTEIWEWTGVTLDTFVNFLTLPDGENEGGDEKEGQGVKIVAVSEWEGEVRRVVEVEGHGTGGDEVEMGMVREAYLSAVDVEATLNGDALDVGIFAPGDMLGPETADGLVRGLKLELERQ